MESCRVCSANLLCSSFKATIARDAKNEWGCTHGDTDAAMRVACRERASQLTHGCAYRGRRPVIESEAQPAGRPCR